MFKIRYTPPLEGAEIGIPLRDITELRKPPTLPQLEVWKKACKLFTNFNSTTFGVKPARGRLGIEVVGIIVLDEQAYYVVVTQHKIVWTAIYNCCIITSRF